MLRQLNMTSDLQQEFLQAYDSYAEALYRHCFFRVFSRERAEELVQDTFMKTWQYVKEGNKVLNYKPFLYRVANNLIIDHSRKKKEDSLEALMENNPGAEPSYDGSMEMEQRVLMRDVYKAMEQLPPESKQLLIMRFVDDLDPRDIAEILEISPNHVSVKLNRAIKALKQFIEY